MRVMVMVKATPDSEAGVLPSEQLLTEMGKYNEELSRAGILLAGEGLQPSSRGVRMKFTGKERTVIDGPFSETKELIAGYWLWQVKSMQEAIDWLQRCPNPHNEESEIEIRPLFSAEDFGDAMTPELRESEARLRAKSAGLEEPRFEEGPRLVIAGLNASYNGENRGKIPQQWETFAPHIGQVPGQVGHMTYGVCWNPKPEQGELDYLTGVEVSETSQLPANFPRVTISPGRYVVVPFEGHVSKIPEVLDTIWKEWFPATGLKSAEAPWFERYTERFDPRSGRGGIEFWIPLA